MNSISKADPGSGNLDIALAAAGVDEDAGEFLTGQELTIEHIQRLSSTIHDLINVFVLINAWWTKSTVWWLMLQQQHPSTTRVGGIRRFRGTVILYFLIAASNSDQMFANSETSEPSLPERKALTVDMPQFGALEATMDGSVSTDSPSPGRETTSAVPTVAPLPKIHSPGRRPRPLSAVDPASPSKSTPGDASKRRSPLPRVAMLASQTPSSTRRQSKTSSPPFRAGGKAAIPSDVSPAVSRKQTPSRIPGSTPPTSTASAKLRTSSKTLSERPQWGANHPSDKTPPRRTATTPSRTPPSGSRRAIAKPPENIKRAIKESQALSKMDSLDSKEDSDMKNLKAILQDIKTIKSELGVQSDTPVEQDTGLEADAESRPQEPPTAEEELVDDQNEEETKSEGGGVKEEEHEEQDFIAPLDDMELDDEEQWLTEEPKEESAPVIVQEQEDQTHETNETETKALETSSDIPPPKAETVAAKQLCSCSIM
jgi:hypothetical protein